MKISKQSIAIYAIACIVATSAFADGTNVAIANLEPIVLKFAAFDPTHTLISEDQIIKSLGREIISNSKIPLKGTREASYIIYNGIRSYSDSKNSTIYIQYMDIERHNTGGEYGESLTIPVNYKIERGTDDLTIQLTSPENAEFKSEKFLLLGLGRKLRPANELLDDYSNVFKTANSVSLSLSSIVKGEFVASFKSESVLANFERLLGRYQPGYSEALVYDIKRDNVFSYLLNKKRIPIKVATFPYRDGTKIIYEANIPYSIKADGSTDGYSLVDKLKDDISKIVND